MKETEITPVLPPYSDKPLLLSCYSGYGHSQPHHTITTGIQCMFNVLLSYPHFTHTPVVH